MTTRQSRLLKAIIDEFIDSAEAVGSVNLSNKYKLGVSPATIRNEMAELVKQGYLAKPHSSSGRIPTNLGFKFFIERLLSELDEIDVEVSSRIREDLFRTRFDTDKLLYEAVNILSREANNLALALFENRIYYAGLYRLVDKPDFEGVSDIKEIMKILEDYRLLLNIFNKYRGQKSIRVLIGEDTGYGSFTKMAVIFSPIRLHGNAQGFLALVGPNRMNYSHNIPLLEYLALNINDVISGW